MHILEVVFLVLLPAFAACLSFYDIVVLLKKGLKGQTITHHEVFFTCSQFTSWVSLLNLLLSWLKYVCNEWWFRSDKKKRKEWWFRYMSLDLLPLLTIMFFCCRWLSCYSWKANTGSLYFSIVSCVFGGLWNLSWKSLTCRQNFCHFRYFYTILLIFCNVYNLTGLGCKLSPSCVAVGSMPLFPLRNFSWFY